MKTTFILKQAMVEKGFKNLQQALPILLFTLFLSILPKVVQDVIGQPTKEWDKIIGGGSDDVLSSVISTPDGGYLLVGTSYSPASGDKSENRKGGCNPFCSTDYWIVKTDAQGNKVWDKTFGGNNDDDIASAISTPDGGYLLAGTSVSPASGDKSENSKGGSDYWIVKTDVQGNKLWDKTFGGNSGEGLSSVIPTPDGGYLLAGSSDSNASVYSGAK